MQTGPARDSVPIGEGQRPVQRAEEIPRQKRRILFCDKSLTVSDQRVEKCQQPAETDAVFETMQVIAKVGKDPPPGNTKVRGAIDTEVQRPVRRQAAGQVGERPRGIWDVGQDAMTRDEIEAAPDFLREVATGQIADHKADFSRRFQTSL